MSRGSRKRRAGAPFAPGTDHPDGVGATGYRRVWFVATEGGSEDQELLLRSARRACSDHGWLFGVRRTSTERILGGSEKDRPYRLLRGRDAWDIYRSLHANPCLVLASHRALVKSDPSQSPATLRELVPLSDFVEHKAFYALARGEEEVREAIEALGRWPGEDCCEDERDPRALPLHVFDPTTAWPSLWSEVGRLDFERRYGVKGSARRDFAGRVWERPSALHGSPDGTGNPLVVAGRTMPTGYHWDVQRGRGKERITNTHEVWLVGPGGYLNIYPNAHIRTGSRSRRVWQDER